MKKITLLLLLALAPVLHAQNFEWVKTPPINLSLNPDMVGYSTACDNNGNIYFLGFKDNAVPYNSIMGKLHFIKYDNTGQVLFSKEITGSAASHDMTTDSEGNTIMALSYLETITIDDLTLTNNEQGEKWLAAKFNPQGELTWYEPIELSTTDWNYVNNFSTVAVDAQDNVYFGFGNFINTYVAVYSKFSNFLYMIEQANVSMITSISTDDAGNIYTAGSCAGNDAVFAGSPANSGLQYNTYVAKYNNQAQLEWVKFVEDITCSVAMVKAYSENEIYFSSYLTVDNTFDNIVTEGPAGSAFEDFFLAKLNTEGNYQWIKEVIGSGKVSPGSRRFLTCDDSGNVYFTGQTSGEIDWGNGQTTSTAGSSRQAIILKYNNNGEVTLAKNTSSTGTFSNNNADAVYADNQGDIYVTGMAYGDVVFDEISLNSASQQYYPFLAKISSETMGTQDDEQKNVVLFPNPAQDHFTISGITNSEPIEIVDMLGQTLYKTMCTEYGFVQLPHLRSGNYIVKAPNTKPLRLVIE